MPTARTCTWLVLASFPGSTPSFYTMFSLHSVKKLGGGGGGAWKQGYSFTLPSPHYTHAHPSLFLSLSLSLMYTQGLSDQQCTTSEAPPPQTATPPLPVSSVGWISPPRAAGATPSPSSHAMRNLWVGCGHVPEYSNRSEFSSH